MSDFYDLQSFVPNRNVLSLVGRVKSVAASALDQALASDPELGPLEMTSAQYLIIATLALREADSATQLCKSFSYDPGAMTRMVDRLEGKGLIRRHRSSDDRRLINLELTEAGKEVFPKMKALSMAVQNRFLRGLTRKEVEELEGFLTRILSNV